MCLRLEGMRLQLTQDQLSSLLFSQEILQPLSHLSSSLVRKRDGGDLVRLILVLADQMSNPRGEHSGLSRARACENLQRDIRGSCDSCELVERRLGCTSQLRLVQRRQILVRREFQFSCIWHGECAQAQPRPSWTLRMQKSDKNVNKRSGHLSFTRGISPPQLVMRGTTSQPYRSMRLHCRRYQAEMTAKDFEVADSPILNLAHVAEGESRPIHVATVNV